MASETADKAKTSRGGEASLEDQVAQLRHDLKSIAATIAGLAESRVAATREGAEHEIQNLMRSGQHAVEGVQGELSHLETQMKQAIRRRPITAVAGAILVGFLLALLTR